jgi:hypothetical protein
VARATTGPAGAPSIAFVVLDDVGFADLGCYGSDIATPHIDGLAAGSLPLHELPRHLHVLADACVSADRSQCARGRHRNHRRVVDGIPGVPGTDRAQCGHAGVLYMKDGRLVHEYIYSETVRHVIVSDAPVAAGARRLRYQFTRTGAGQGRGRLYVDDRRVGVNEVPKTWPLHASQHLAPPVDGCRPASTSARPVATPQDTPSLSRPSALRVISAAAGSSR